MSRDSPFSMRSKNFKISFLIGSGLRCSPLNVHRRLKEEPPTRDSIYSLQKNPGLKLTDTHTQRSLCILNNFVLVVSFFLCHNEDIYTSQFNGHDSEDCFASLQFVFCLSCLEVICVRHPLIVQIDNYI